MKEKPKHIAIIMDGNGRWAKLKKKPRIFGHKSGIKRVSKIVEYSINNDIDILTLHTFSSENWLRPRLEIKALMKLIVTTIDNEIKKLMDNNVKIRILGDISALPTEVCNKLKEAIELTRENNKLVLNLAINYGSKEEIVNAIKLISNDLLENKIKVNDISKTLLETKLYTYPYRDPDLLIRTGGESRISNFLLWQLAYTEIVISEKFWPDYSCLDLEKDIESNGLTDFNNKEIFFEKEGILVLKFLLII